MKKKAKKKSTGQPVFSFRCPTKVSNAYRRLARKRKLRVGAMLVEHMTTAAKGHR